MLRKFAIIACALLMVATTVVTQAKAQDEAALVLRTNAPLEFPRFVLEPGVYNLRFVDSATGTQVVEVTGSNGKAYGMFEVRPVSRLTAADHLELKLQPQSDAPARVKDWFTAGSTTGFAPIYPTHARSMASPPSPSGAGN